MVARWADGEEVAAALFEDAFGGAEYFFACAFHVHGTGRGAVSKGYFWT